MGFMTKPMAVSTQKEHSNTQKCSELIFTASHPHTQPFNPPILQQKKPSGISHELGTKPAVDTAG